MRPLYEIDEAIENCFDPETGECINEEDFESLQIEREKKIEGVLLLYKNLTAEAEMLKTEERNITDRRRAVEKRADGVKGYLAGALEGKPYKSAKVTARFYCRPRVEILEPWRIPKEYMRKRDPEPDKTAISKAIKAGKTVDGAQLVDSVSLSIK